ncbi:DUF2909 domain-containing protein [Aestuariibacter salexigens]|uniref:DUF2909 domain-containing protein n=1 Tax=Aestuariibacter salexigens TaxID=226010 RepID=UPI00042A8F29|nr:DUF2909 domain-containing protein [Aestuariibacter salexigens]
MFVKIIIGLLLVFMIFNLGKAFFIMIRHEPGKEPMSKFIGRRVMTSALIILLILIAVATGLIEPNPRPY